jgi:hypothetical protein
LRTLPVTSIRGDSHGAVAPATAPLFYDTPVTGEEDVRRGLTMRAKPSATSLAALLLSVSLAAAWPPVVRAAASVRASSTTPDSKALALLDDIIADARALRLAENRALAQADAADLLWARDEQRARSLFDEAVVNVAEILSGVPADEAEDESLSQEREALLQSVLETVARHDARLALALLRSAAQPPREPRARLRLELSLAARMAADDPRQAVRLAEETLERGVVGGLPDLIAEVQGRDHEAAAQLARAVVTKLRSTDLAADEEAAAVALGLFRLGAEPQPGPIMTDPPTTLLDRQSLQVLAEMVVMAALATSADSADLLHELQPLLEDVERYAPARAPLVRRKLARLTKATGGPSVSSPDIARRGEAVEDGLRAGSGDEARPPLVDPRTPAERAAALVELARTLTEKNRRERAGELLEEASVLVGKRAHSLVQLGAQLQVACVYARVDPARGLGVMGLLVDRLDELADAAVVVDGFLTEERLARDDELKLKPVSDYVDALPDETAEDFALLAWARFDEMKQTADGFRRAELRLMARLLLARSVLTRRPFVNHRLASAFTPGAWSAPAARDSHLGLTARQSPD